MHPAGTSRNACARVSVHSPTYGLMHHNASAGHRVALALGACRLQRKTHSQQCIAAASSGARLQAGAGRLLFFTAGMQGQSSASCNVQAKQEALLYKQPCPTRPPAHEKQQRRNIRGMKCPDAVASCSVAKPGMWCEHAYQQQCGCAGRDAQGHSADIDPQRLNCIKERDDMVWRATCVHTVQVTMLVDDLQGSLLHNTDGAA